MNSPDAPCTCGHDRNDHEDSGFGGCRRCHCGQYEPDYSVDAPAEKNETPGAVFD